MGPCERGSLCPQMQLSCARDLTHQMGRFTAPVRTEMTTWHIQDSWTLWPSNLRPLCTQPGLFMETSAPAGEGSSLGLQKSTENPSSSFRALGRWHNHLHSQTRKLRLRKMAHPILSNGDREDYWGAWTPAREGWPGPGAHGVIQVIFCPWIGHNFSSSWTSKTLSLC